MWTLVVSRMLKGQLILICLLYSAKSSWTYRITDLRDEWPAMESNMIEDLPEKHKRYGYQEPQLNRAEMGKFTILS